MKDVEKKVWGMISPPNIYFFLQMIIEVVLALVVFIRKMAEYDRMYRYTSNTMELQMQIQEAIINNASYITFVAAIAGAIVFGMIYYRSIRSGAFQKEKKVLINDMITPMIIAAVTSIALSTVLSYMNLDNIYGSYENTQRTLLSGNIVYRIFAIGVIVPLAEEYVYRGVMYNRIKNEFGFFGAIFFSALAFGLFHFNLLQGVYAFTIGILLAYFYEKYGNIKVPVAMHMSINIIAIIVDYYI